MELKWVVDMPRLEKGYKNERNYSAVAFRNAGENGTVKTIGQRKEQIRENFSTRLQWVGFQNYSDALFTDANFVPTLTGGIQKLIFDIPAIVEKLKLMNNRGKRSIIMAVAEGYHDGVVVLQEKLKEAGCPFPTRAVVLGHLLRGGDPCPDDRILATQCGNLAVKAILKGETDKMAGVTNNIPTLVPLTEAIEGHREVPRDLVQLLECVS